MKHLLFVLPFAFALPFSAMACSSGAAACQAGGAAIGAEVGGVPGAVVGAVVGEGVHQLGHAFMDGTSEHLAGMEGRNYVESDDFDNPFLPTSLGGTGSMPLHIHEQMLMNQLQ